LDLLSKHKNHLRKSQGKNIKRRQYIVEKVLENTINSNEYYSILKLKLDMF
jgi:hypothetical protein